MLDKIIIIPIAYFGMLAMSVFLIILSVLLNSAEPVNIMIEEVLRIKQGDRHA